MLADWTRHSISRDAATLAKAALNMREVSSIDVKFVRIRVLCWKRQSSRMLPSNGKKRHGGGGVMIPALGTLAPHLSWSIDKWLHTLSAKRTPLSASCSHPMFLENREQAVERGRSETLAT